MIARRVFVEGHTQGVFFREWTVKLARELGVEGWVRNRCDGSVEVLAVGEPASIQPFIERLRGGSPASRVDQLRIEDAKGEQASGFSRRQTV